MFGRKQEEAAEEEQPSGEAVKEESETSQEAAEPAVEEPAPEQASEEPEAAEEEPKDKKDGFFSRITKVKLSEERFDDVFWDLEVALLENNVAMEVIEKVKADLREALAGEKVSRKGVQGLILDTLKESIKEALSVEQVDLLAEAEEHQPLVIAMIGVNGSGKTTTLAKLAKYFQDHGKSVVAAAADTFRAAAIQQLEEHTTKLGVKLIKHDYQADPAAVAFDAVKHARAKGIDVVLIDSAGRLHSNDNLMNELKKLIKVNQPDLNIFVGEAITGNDCVEQAKLFDQAVGIDALILAKADVDEKGGAPLSASYVTRKPVIFLGTGQSYEDLTPFKPDEVLEKLGL
ncbi:signal recognition particle-docking protein FtsY [Candidatus Woesearchaeota archaeon]|nr:signal recognition particle-docking protein FtsY [Candidatus Woesearchaeota archaeon]